MKNQATTLVLGGNGQLGQELIRALMPLGRLVAATRTSHLVNGQDCEIVDLGRIKTVEALLDRVRPDLVVNAAAYTAVDRAEVEVEEAWLANASAPGVIARWCAAAGVPLVHYSTDYVFDGKGERPYREDDATGPLSVYGASKLAGEEAIRAAGGRHLIFRTAWVYASHSANFLRTMLRVGAERDVLRVVADQVGTPTPAALIADVTAQALKHPGQFSGTWHLTSRGETSWHGFAEAIFSEAVAAGKLVRSPLVEAITTAEYPTPARRPAYSHLDVTKLESDFGIVLPSWEDGLRRVLSEWVTDPI